MKNAGTRQLALLLLGCCVMACSETKPTATPDAIKQTETSDLTNDDFITDDQDTDNQITSIEDLLDECGLDKDALDDPDTVLLDKTFYSWPKVVVGSKNAPFIGNVNYKVKVVTKTKIKATMGAMTSETDFEIEAIPSAAQSEAEAQVADKRAQMKATALGFEERQEKLAEEEDWENITCTLSAIRKTKTISGKGTVEAEYEPALPMSLNPKATLARYEAELGDGRSFRVTAKVTRSSNPDIRKGEHEGDVYIERVKPNLLLDAGSRGTVKVPSDIAYRLTFDFGSPEKTLALGFQASQTIFLSVRKKEMQAIVVDAGEDGNIVLSDQFEDGI